jgi:hypothetical protein
MAEQKRGADGAFVCAYRATITRLHQGGGRRPPRAVPAGERVGPKLPGKFSPQAGVAENPPPRRRIPLTAA